MNATAITARASTSNQSGPSQATAPVLEFRCLFTRDVHKKAKKWHDGTLRYHTFNKRVMVYDETSFHVGDVHYRGDEELGEGLELSLDRPILVEVGEPVGRTETDLNQVLHHRPSPEKPTILSSARPSAASQVRPKSIKEVLGASQGQISRARVPYQSPYDRRQAMQSSHPAEPPAKRVKVGPDKENRPQPVQPTSASPKPTFSKPQRQVPSPKRPRPSHNKGSTQELVGRVEAVYDVSSDDEPAQVIRPPLARAQQQAKQANGAASNNTKDTRCSSAKSTSAEQRSAEGQSKPKKKPQNQRDIHPAPASPRTAPTRSVSASNVYTPRPGTTQLQLSREKPRRRLMYRALLPSSTLPSERPRRDSVDQSIAQPSTQDRRTQDDEEDPFESSAHRNRSPPPFERPSRSFSASTGDNRQAAHVNTPERLGLANQPINIPSSPLFVSQDVAHATPSAVPALESSQEFETRMLEGAKSPGQTIEDPIDLSPRQPSIPFTTPRDINISSTKFVEDLSPSPPSSKSPSPEIVDVPRPQTTQERMPPPPLPVIASKPAHDVSINGTRPSSRHGPIRRTLSANDAEDSIDDELLDNIPSDTQFGGPANLLSEFPPTAVLLQPQPNRSPARRTSPRKGQAAAATAAQLRRTFSDPVAVDSRDVTERIVTMNGVNVEQPEVEPGEEETGPWSVKEAWLLFGSEGWHDGRRGELPEWATASASVGLGGGQAMEGAAGTERGGGVAGRGIMGGFGSARGLLERERTAQGTGVLRDEEGAY